MTSPDELWTPDGSNTGSQLWTPGAHVVRLGRALSKPSHMNPLILEVQSKQHPGLTKIIAVYPQGGAYPPHCLIVGATRGGKTTAVRYFVTGLVRFPDTNLHLADGKFAGSFMMFEDLPGVLGVADTADDVETMVFAFFEEVEHKYGELKKAMRRAKKTHEQARYTWPNPEWLVLDDYLNWALSLESRRRAEVINALVRIGAIGGEVDMRLWLATQRPDSAKSIEAGLPGILKAQLKCRIAQVGLMGLDSMESRMGFDEDGAGKWLEAEAKRAGLPDMRGLGMIQIGAYRIAYKTNWIANPLHPLTSATDRDAAWKLLGVDTTQPRDAVDTELEAILDGQGEPPDEGGRA